MAVLQTAVLTASPSRQVKLGLSTTLKFSINKFRFQSRSLITADAKLEFSDYFCYNSPMSPDNKAEFGQPLLPKKGEYMPAATAPFLSYGDFITPNSSLVILEPNAIPVHPDIFLSPLVYTKEFAAEVAMSVPSSIRQDVAEIERKLGVHLGMEVTEEGVAHVNRITQANEIIYFKDFAVTVSPGETGFVEVDYNKGDATSIALVRKGYCQRVFSPDNSHPMPEEKFKAYGYPPGDYDIKLPTWYIHNLRFVGLGGLLYFRNFAIMFNNLGLKKVGNRL